MDSISAMYKAYELRHKEYLTYQIIADFISELYEPYKILFDNYNDYKNYMDSLPRYSFVDEWNETPKHIEEKNGIYKVLQGAKTGSDRLRAYSMINKKSLLLLKIRRLQHEKDAKPNHSNNLDFFDNIEKEIDKLFDKVLESQSEKVTPLFKDENNLKLFSNYIKSKIDEPHKDISHLYQRLLKETMIIRITHKEFMSWLYKNKFIETNIYEMLIEKGEFMSLKKSESKFRKEKFESFFFNENKPL